MAIVTPDNLKFRGALIVTVLWLVAVGVVWFFFDQFYPYKMSVATSMGGFFGGIFGPFVSVFALSALIQTIGINLKQLNTANAALEMQEEHWQKQSFEHTFFQLLNLYAEGVKNLDSTGYPLVGEGKPEIHYRERFFLRRLYAELGHYLKVEELMSRGSGKSQRSMMSDAYDRFDSDSHLLLYSYFQTIFHILKFIDNSSGDAVDRNFYISVMRGQLSRPELGLLYYYVIAGEGGMEFARLLMIYGVLNDLDPSELHSWNHSNFFPAIGRSRPEQQASAAAS